MLTAPEIGEAPTYHWTLPVAAVVSVTLPPMQNVVGPPALIDGDGGVHAGAVMLMFASRPVASPAKLPLPKPTVNSIVSPAAMVVITSNGSGVL